MKTISVIARKGGAGKTTLATNLAAALATTSSVTLVDIDPQASSALWGQRRSTRNPKIVMAQPPLLASIIQDARIRGDHWCVIDTPPHADAAALAAAAEADAVLVPVRPSQLDLDALPAVVQMLRLASKAAAIIINGAQPQAKHTDLLEALTATGFDVSPVIIRQRSAYVNAVAEGLGVTESNDLKAAAEVNDLMEWVEQWLNQS